MLGAMLLTSCTHRNVSNGNQSSSVYDKVISSGEIKVGYMSYAPGFIVNPNNTQEFSGIMNEVFTKVAENLDLKIKYEEEVTWATLVESVKTGKVDIIISPIWPTSQRGKYADFTIPVYLGGLRAYCRANDDRFDNNLDRINSEDINISVIDGEISTNVAEEDFPKATKNSLPNTTDISQMLMNVKDGKADVAFVEPYVAASFIKENPNVIKEVKAEKPLRIYPKTMMMKKGEYELKSMIDVAIQELLNQGYVDKVLKKYEPFEGVFYKNALPYQQE